MRVALAVVLLSGSLLAQYPAGANALHWSGATSSAGPFCWGFSCTPDQATIVPGETGTLMVRAELNQVYTIGMAAGASRCLSFPFVYNGLVLDDPILFVRFGVCGQPSPILACPSGFDAITVRIPTGLTRGVRTSLQAVVGVPSGPSLPSFSFTQTITFTVI